MQYYDRIRELREDHDMTQEAVAKILDTTQGYYSKYELGKREIPIDRLIKLCLLYGVSADYILGLPKGLKWER
ncbi:MAG: helix-turn-helix transcriptional regulator [Oscillospiraceae bacterium]